jgi:uncharacterized OsmC-like protein
MKLTLLKDNQARLKAVYKTEPERARQTLFARGTVDFSNLAARIVEPKLFDPAGLHPAGGGDGTFACPVEIFLAGLVTCAGVTLAAVATSMRLEISSATVRAEGDLDFRGTLAVDREAPVGLTAIRLSFDLNSTAPAEQLAKLIELTQRYCVVHRTLETPPVVEVDWMVVTG